MRSEALMVDEAPGKVSGVQNLLNPSDQLLPEKGGV